MSQIVHSIVHHNVTVVYVRRRSQEACFYEDISILLVRDLIFSRTKGYCWRFTVNSDRTGVSRLMLRGAICWKHFKAKLVYIMTEICYVFASCQTFFQSKDVHSVTAWKVFCYIWFRPIRVRGGIRVNMFRYLRPPERYFAWMKYFKIIIITYKISIIWNRHLVVYIEHGIDIFVIDYYLNLW